MQILSPSECVYVHGGYEHNFYEGILVGGVFSCMFSVAGSALGIAWYLGSANAAAAPLGTLYHSINHISMITLPIAIFAGIGLGAVMGALTGIGLYYAGVVSEPE